MKKSNTFWFPPNFCWFGHSKLANGKWFSKCSEGSECLVNGPKKNISKCLNSELGAKLKVSAFVKHQSVTCCQESNDGIYAIVNEHVAVAR